MEKMEGGELFDKIIEKGFGTISQLHNRPAQ